MKLTVASSPHIRGDFKSSRIMLDVMLALVPAMVVGIWMHGFRSLIVTLVSIASCVLLEWLYAKVTKTRNTVIDGAALVTGMLLAMTLPATVPYWLVVVGCAFAIMLVVNFFSLRFSSIVLMIAAGTISLALFLRKGGAAK